MKEKGWVSTYTKAHYKHHSTKCNEATIHNMLDRQFNSDTPLKAVVTDLTYVRVGTKWHYVCLILDCFNREIIGYSCGPNKTAELVKQAITKILYPLDQIQLFHTDRGKEFDNQLIDDVLTTFQIERSLSHKGCPYDNAVAESTYKSLKVEFIILQLFIR